MLGLLKLTFLNLGSIHTKFFRIFVHYYCISPQRRPMRPPCCLSHQYPALNENRNNLNENTNNTFTDENKLKICRLYYLRYYYFFLSKEYARHLSFVEGLSQLVLLHFPLLVSLKRSDPVKHRLHNNITPLPKLF